jgi:hypothetical protein
MKFDIFKSVNQPNIIIIMLTDVANIFIEVDDFYKIYERELIQQLPQVLGSDVPDIKNYSLCPSEVMTIVIAFHLSSYRNFKHF